MAVHAYARENLVMNALSARPDPGAYGKAFKLEVEMMIHHACNLTQMQSFTYAFVLNHVPVYHINLYTFLVSCSRMRPRGNNDMYP